MGRAKLAIMVLAFFALASVLVAPASSADPRSIDHERVVKFWTVDKIAKAIPRDFIRTSSGRYEPAKKGDSSTVLGASWTEGGDVSETTGKVFFQLGDVFYVCTGSVVDDQTAGRSIVVTAAHCLYDETKSNGSGWATNWIFIPNYDAKPVPLSSTSGEFCDYTKYGCWVADFFVASQGFTTAGGFTDTATVHDYAFAVVSGGGFSGSASLDSLGSQPMTFGSGQIDANTYVFGYPASGRYKGGDLVYSLGALSTDSRNSNNTYRVTSNMTGGSSGGPWFQAFSSGSGNVMSVTSYGYQGVKALFGPKLGDEARDMFTLAKARSLSDGNYEFPHP